MNAKHSTEIDPFSKFIGRLETEIEVYAHYVLHCTPEELTTRVGSALVGSVAEQQFDVAALPNLHQRPTAKPHLRLREVALGDGAHRNGSSDKVSRTGQWWYDRTPEQREAIKAKRAATMTRNLTPTRSGASRRAKNFWEGKTQEERSKEMHRRQLVSIIKGKKMGRGRMGPPTAKEIMAAKKELFALMTPEERRAHQREQNRTQKARSRAAKREMLLAAKVSP